MNAGVTSRIALRYLAGYLVFRSVLPQDVADMIASDQDLALAVGAGITVLVEGAYTAAKRMGWRT